DELFARHNKDQMRRAVDELDSWHLAGLSELSDLDPPRLESLVQRDIVQAVNAGPTQMKDFDRALLLVADELEAHQRIEDAGSLSGHCASFLCAKVERARRKTPLVEGYSSSIPDSIVGGFESVRWGRHAFVVCATVAHYRSISPRHKIPHCRSRKLR